MSPNKWQDMLKQIGSMRGIFTYICHKNQPNVGKYTRHGSYGKCLHHLSVVTPEALKIPSEEMDVYM